MMRSRTTRRLSTDYIFGFTAARDNKRFQKQQTSLPMPPAGSLAASLRAWHSACHCRHMNDVASLALYSKVWL